MILRIARRLLGIPQPAVSRERALAIAQGVCEQRGWPWTLPVRCSIGLRHYTVAYWMHPHRKGGYVCIRIDTQSGAVLNAAVSPR
jgi:hypothetical protein